MLNFQNKIHIVILHHCNPIFLDFEVVKIRHTDHKPQNDHGAVGILVYAGLNVFRAHKSPRPLPPPNTRLPLTRTAIKTSFQSFSLFLVWALGKYCLVRMSPSTFSGMDFLSSDFGWTCTAYNHNYFLLSQRSLDPAIRIVTSQMEHRTLHVRSLHLLKAGGGSKFKRQQLRVSLLLNPIRPGLLPCNPQMFPPSS
jgi:hypothetical protein